MTAETQGALHRGATGVCLSKMSAEMLNDPLEFGRTLEHKPGIYPVFTNELINFNFKRVDFFGREGDAVAVLGAPTLGPVKGDSM